ncbi:hypothetical protein KKF05_02765 [Patescibacteria group bacterium]|nr:hypothetical protein [Patescibacteria group bacterium]
MDFDPTISLILISFGLTIFGARLVITMLKNSGEGDEDPKRLSNDQVPALPPKLGSPYRHNDELTDSDESNDEDPDDDEERLRRFVYAASRLREQLSEVELRRLAEQLYLDGLLDSIEQDDVDSDWESAAIYAFSLRCKPEDIPPLVEILETSHCTYARLAAMKALASRGPSNHRVINAVVKCALADNSWSEKDNERTKQEIEQLRSAGQQVLTQWEKDFSEIMTRFVTSS